MTRAAYDSARGAQLNSQGFALMNQGDYDEAIPVLQQAVKSFPPGTSDLNYAYALFNLGKSLRLAGRPDEAIPVLEQRLKIPNQTGRSSRSSSSLSSKPARSSGASWRAEPVRQLHARRVAELRAASRPQPCVTSASAGRGLVARAAARASPASRASASRSGTGRQPDTLYASARAGRAAAPRRCRSTTSST